MIFVRIAFLISCLGTLPAAHAEFQAGFGKAKITPVLEDTWIDADHDGAYNPAKGDRFIDGNINGKFDAIWLAGFDYSRAAVAVHDDLWALASVIDDGDKRIAFVALDAIGFLFNEVEDIRSRLPREWKINHLILTSTHNHEAPDLLVLWGRDKYHTGVIPAYMEYTKTQALIAIGSAVTALKPAEPSQPSIMTV